LAFMADAPGTIFSMSLAAAPPAPPLRRPGVGVACSGVFLGPPWSGRAARPTRGPCQLLGQQQQQQAEAEQCSQRRGFLVANAGRRKTRVLARVNANAFSQMKKKINKKCRLYCAETFVNNVRSTVD